MLQGRTQGFAPAPGISYYTESEEQLIQGEYMNVKPSAVFRHADNIVTRKVMGETLLVPISGEMASMDNLYSLNDTGAFLWQSFNGKRSLSDIGRKMAEQYDASVEVIEADLVEITAGLAEVGLVMAEGEN